MAGNGAAAWAVATLNNHRLTGLVSQLPAVVICYNSAGIYLALALGDPMSGYAGLFEQEVNRRPMSPAGTRREPEMRQILFVQGGGAGAHDEWDDKLVASLERELGGAWEVRYPRMPDEDDPTYAVWGTAIQCEVAALADGAVVVGHSVGATLLVQALADQPPQPELQAIVLIAAPFVGAGGWSSEEFELPDDLGARLPRDAQVHVFHGLDDQTAPPSHADLYARVIGQAQVHRLSGRDHQLNGDLSEVARVIEHLT